MKHEFIFTSFTRSERFRKSLPIPPGLVAVLVMLLFAQPVYGQGQSANNDTQKTQNVTVVNRPANPVQVRDVDNPAQQPVSVEVELTLLNGFQDTAGVIYGVPPGKLLVIEYFSARAKLPHTQTIAEIGCTINQNNAPSVSTYVEATHMTSTSAQEFFVSSKLVRIYAGSESHVSVFLKRLPLTTGTGQVLFSIQGYLVDVPPLNATAKDQ
jgi:hypothetical protein